MPAYDYQCLTCDEIYELVHGISIGPYKEHECPKCESVQPCKRLIAPSFCTPVFKGEGWTVKSSGYGKRGYKGKYEKLIRDPGTPVDAPADKAEADRQFDKWVDSGGLDGIEPTVNLNEKAKPMTGEERIDKGKKK